MDKILILSLNDLGAASTAVIIIKVFGNFSTRD